MFKQKSQLDMSKVELNICISEAVVGVPSRPRLTAERRIVEYLIYIYVVIMLAPLTLWWWYALVNSKH